MTRRARTVIRCVHCRIHTDLCFCGEIHPISTRTRVLLVLHRLEDRKSTNTGRLATKCLLNSEVLLRGQLSGLDEEPRIDPATQPLVLFPQEGAIPLTEYQGSKRPITLVVPDGNWRQASKVRARIPALANVPVVSLPPGPPSIYRLRKEVTEGALSTMEAIARALGILEGPDAQEALERVFRILVERTLWSRGTIVESEMADGLPSQEPAI